MSDEIFENITLNASNIDEYLSILTGSINLMKYSENSSNSEYGIWLYYNYNTRSSVLGKTYAASITFLKDMYLSFLLSVPDYKNAANPAHVYFYLNDECIFDYLSNENPQNCTSDYGTYSRIMNIAGKKGSDLTILFTLPSDISDYTYPTLYVRIDLKYFVATSLSTGGDDLSKVLYLDDEGLRKLCDLVAADLNSTNKLATEAKELAEANSGRALKPTVYANITMQSGGGAAEVILDDSFFNSQFFSVYIHSDSQFVSLSNSSDEIIDADDVAGVYKASYYSQLYQTPPKELLTKVSGSKTYRLHDFVYFYEDRTSTVENVTPYSREVSFTVSTDSVVTLYFTHNTAYELQIIIYN